jgi:hypothetical protein
VQSKDLKVTDGAAAGGWIKPRLGGEYGAVTLQVPKGYDAYARVFHPAFDPEGSPVSWAEVAKATGTTAHREMQWHAILGVSDTDGLRGFHEPGTLSRLTWAGFDPPTGRMDLKTLDALCEILAEHTADPAHCFFGLCTITGWEDSFSKAELHGQRLLKLPLGRDQIVLTAPLSAVDQIVRDRSANMTFTFYKGEGPRPKLDPSWLRSREAPNLIWPPDHSWLVVSEVDFDSTLVGGSTTLIEAIVDSSALEAWAVKPDDSLTEDADKINGIRTVR